MARMYASREAAKKTESKRAWDGRPRGIEGSFPRDWQDNRLSEPHPLRGASPLAAPAPAPIQRKATVSVPSDPLEKAADEGAEKLLRMEEPAFENGASGTIQRKCASCEDEDETNKIHAKRDGGTNDSAAMDTSSAIAAAQRPGLPLPGQTRAFFEPRMGADLSGVRIHADAEAARAAAGVQAKAYTWRDKIVFGAGEYAPETDSGKRLLAHELMHWRQQAGGAGGVVQREEGDPPNCGKHFKQEFVGKINDKTPDPKTLTPRKFFKEPKRTGPTVGDLVTGTEVKVGQLERKDWRAVCHAVKPMPAQILWVLDEYISEVDANGEIKPRKTEASKPAATPTASKAPAPAVVKPGPYRIKVGATDLVVPGKEKDKRERLPSGTEVDVTRVKKDNEGVVWADVTVVAKSPTTSEDDFNTKFRGHTGSIQASSLIARPPEPKTAAPGATSGDVAAQPSGSLSIYQYNGSVFRVGMVAGPNVLVGIDIYPGGHVRFLWVNFRRNKANVGGPADWDHLVGGAAIGLSNDGFGDVGASLGETDLRALQNAPSQSILATHEAGKINLPDGAVLSAYSGLIESEAFKALATNEQAIDELLTQPDRINKLNEYAVELKEASIIRDALEVRRNDLKAARPGQHSLSGLPKTPGAVADPHLLMQVAMELREIESALAFWYAAFPLITHLKTNELHGGQVEATLLGLKANIISTRAELLQTRVGKGSFGLWDLDNIRGQLQASLGPKAAAVVEAEDKSRARWGLAKAAGMIAGSIGLLFLPGGTFLNAAIGVAMASQAWNDAEVIGRAANSSMHADEGLMSQARLAGADFNAVLATVFAVLGSSAVGFRVLKVGRTFVAVARAAPELALGSQIGITRLLLKHPDLFKVALSLAQTEARMQELGVRLTFAELQALRATIFEHLGQTMPPLSAESLEEFLDIVWVRRFRLNSVEDVYDVYSGAREANVLTRSADDYMDALQRLQEGRKGVSDIQGDPTTGYWRFERADVDLTTTTARAYLNVSADHAPEVMKMVVKDIVDNPAVTGVTMAKVSGPNAVAGRADTIIIYLEDQAASRAVLARIRAYQSANPSHFNRTTPFMTNQVSEGVAVGMEPVWEEVPVPKTPAGNEHPRIEALVRHGLVVRTKPGWMKVPVSFGKIRSKAIWQALESTKSGTREDFIQLVAKHLRDVGIDPTKPHVNLHVGRP